MVGAELATNPDAWDRLEDGATRVDESMLAGVEAVLADAERRITMPREFVVPGETPALGRPRAGPHHPAPRRASRDRRSIASASCRAWLMPYLNRLADLLWVLARLAEQAEGVTVEPSRRRG